MAGLNLTAEEEREVAATFQIEAVMTTISFYSGLVISSYNFVILLLRHRPVIELSGNELLPMNSMSDGCLSIILHSRSRTRRPAILLIGNLALRYRQYVLLGEELYRTATSNLLFPFTVSLAVVATIQLELEPEDHQARVLRCRTVQASFTFLLLQSAFALGNEYNRLSKSGTAAPV